jgi:hypothetical protein
MSSKYHYDSHGEEFEELQYSYNGGYDGPAAANVTDWSTRDLVRLAELIDIELQQRADEHEGEE